MSNFKTLKWTNSEGKATVMKASYSPDELAKFIEVLESEGKKVEILSEKEAIEILNA